MDSKTVIERTGLTYGQLNYLLKRVDALNRDKTQGKARKFGPRDLVFLKLASVLREHGYGLDKINEAVTLVDQQWIDDPYFDIGKAGRLSFGYENQIRWELSSNAWYMGNEKTVYMDSVMWIKKYYYNVSKIAEKLFDEETPVMMFSPSKENRSL